MAYKILEKNGVLNENIDGAAFNKFCFHRKNGIVPSVLNECAVQSSSNILTLETGLFAVQGFRVKITEAMSWGMLSSDKTGEYRLVFEVRLYSDRSVEGTFFTQPLTVPLITEDILRSEAGAYQIEVARFVWDGSSILSLKKTLYALSTESGGSVHISQELGDSEEATVSQKVITENLNTKLDKIEKSCGIWAYITEKGGQSLCKCNITPTGWSLPIYGANGVIYTADPTLSVSGDADLACTNKKYVDDLAATKLDVFTVEGNAGNKLYRARADGGQDTVFIGDGADYIAPYYSASKGDVEARAYLWSRDPVKPYQVATKNYVDNAIATVQGQLDTLGTFYEVVKVYSSGTIYVDIPTGAMATAYIESAGFNAYNTDGTLVYTGTANGLTFRDENWSDISSASFTAPAYIQIPENAKQIRVDCEQMIPGDVGWDAGPIVFEGCIYFQVKRG